MSVKPIDDLKFWLLPIALSVSAGTLTGCGSDSNDNEGSGNTAPTSLVVANDVGNERGAIRRYTTQLEAGNSLGVPLQTFNAGLAEGIVLDRGGNLYQAGISNSAGTVRAVCNFHSRARKGIFNGNTDRILTQSLSSPKGSDIAQKAGLIMVAESGAPIDAVSVLSLSAGKNSSPLYTLPRSAMGDTGAWDVAYDEASDKLFIALTNGDVAYYNNFLNKMRNGNSTPTAIFRPDNPLSATNMHGIVYVAADDRLIVSDVADPTSADDGSIYVFETASAQSGTVTPQRTLRGTATRLGNPVDLQIKDGDLYVAEKANDSGRILVFKQVANGSSGDIAPDANYRLNAPESLLAMSVDAEMTADSSDLNGENIRKLLVASNPSNMGMTVASVPKNLATIGASFNATLGGQFVESVALDQNGDGVVSFDDGGTPSAGGISFINRLSIRGGGTFNTLRDRQIIGNKTGLVAPKGVETVGSAGLTLIADLNAAAPGAIKAFSLCAEDNAAPLFTTTLPSDSRPWDMDYDPEADRLYVAATNGTILVYDDYLATKPTAPARTIDPDDKSGFAASNLHGIVHDAATDRLIVSDVGDAGSATDGRIYVIDDAATANGLTRLRLEISGAQSMLGNPVDLVFDGSHLFVAEKSNNQLQRIDNIYSLSGQVVSAPTVSLPFTAPESIALSAATLP